MSNRKNYDKDNYSTISLIGSWMVILVTILVPLIFVIVGFLRFAEVYGVTKTSVRGLQEYQVYKHSGASLTEGKAFAAYIRGTGIGVTVILPNQLKHNMNLNGLAQEILSEMGDRYDTIIVVQDGPDSDIVAYYSNKQKVRDAFLHLNIFQKDVPDAGVFLNSNKASLLTAYVDAGGAPGATTIKQHVEEQKQQTQSTTPTIEPTAESSDEATRKENERIKQEEEEAKRQAAEEAKRKEEVTQKAKDPSRLIANSISGLETSQIYEQLDAQLSHKQLLVDKIAGTSIGITAITSEQLNNRKLDDVANAIQQNTPKYDTIIVVLDGAEDSIGVSSSLNGVAAKIRELLGAEPVSDAGWALLNVSNELVEVHQEELRMIQMNKERDDATKRNQSLLFFGGVAGAVLFAGALVLGGKKLLKVYRKKKAEKEAAKNTLQSQIRNRFASYSKDFQDAIVAFGMVGEEHANILGTYAGNNLASSIKKVRDNLELLADALERNHSDSGQRIKLEVQYADQLTKMARILGSDYYMHMVRRPHAWFDVDERIQLVKDALKALNEQVIENTHQLNENREFEFKVALHSFLNSDEIDTATSNQKNLKDSLKTSVDSIISSIKCEK